MGEKSKYCFGLSEKAKKNWDKIFMNKCENCGGEGKLYWSPMTNEYHSIKTDLFITLSWIQTQTCNICDGKGYL